MPDTQSAVEQVEQLKDAYTHRRQLDPDQTARIEGIYRSLLHFPQDKRTIDVLVFEADQNAAAHLESHVFEVLKTLTWRGDGQINFQRRSEWGLRRRDNPDLYLFGPTLLWDGQTVDTKSLEQKIKLGIPKRNGQNRVVFFYQLGRLFRQFPSWERCFPINILIVSADQYSKYRTHIGAYLEKLKVGDVIDVEERPEFRGLIDRPAFNIVGTPSKEELLKDPSKYAADLAFINLMCIQKPLLDELQLPLIQSYMAANPYTFVRATANEHQAHVMTTGEPHPEVGGGLDSGPNLEEYQKLERYCVSVWEIVRELEKTSRYGLRFFHFLRPDTSLLAKWGNSLALPNPEEGKKSTSPTDTEFPTGTDIERFYRNHANSLVHHFLSGEDLYNLLLEKGVVDERDTKPKVYVVTGVACAGKTTVANRAVKLYRYAKIAVKHRAGALRPHDRAGIDYVVRPESDITEDVKSGKLIGYTHYGRVYGVPVGFIEQTLRRGEDAVVVVGETDAVEKIIKRFGDDIVRPIYLYTTPSALEARLALELGIRDPTEIRQRLAQIREKELASFNQHPELITWWVPNYNPPYPESSTDFAAAKKKYWDDRQIARAANWVTRIFEWEYAHEGIGVSQEQFERSFTETLIQRLFGCDIKKLIDKVKNGDEVRLVINEQLGEYVEWLRKEQQQEVDLDYLTDVIGKRVLYVSEHPTLGLFFEPYMDTIKECGRWSDKELILAYIERLAGPSIHRNNVLAQFPFSAFGGCFLEKGGRRIMIDDGLFYALSLPPSSVGQEGMYRRLTLSFLKGTDDPRGITDRICGLEEKDILRQQHAATMKAVDIQFY